MPLLEYMRAKRVDRSVASMYARTPVRTADIWEELLTIIHRSGGE